MPIPIIFQKTIRTMALVYTMALLSCHTGSLAPPRTEQAPLRHGEVELRIKNNNWSTARIYLVAGTSGGVSVRVATVSSSRPVVKRVRTHLGYYVIKVTLLGSQDQWVGFTEWSAAEECLNVVIEHYIHHTTVWPCRIEIKS